MKLLDEKIEEISLWIDINLVDTEKAEFKIEEFLKLYNEFKSIHTCLLCYGWLVFNEDNTNENALDAMDLVEEREGEVMDSFVKFSKWLNSIENIKGIAGKSEYLEKHRFFLEGLLRKSEYLLDDNGECIINKMQNTGSRAWQRTFMEIFSTETVEIDVNGKKDCVP